MEMMMMTAACRPGVNGLLDVARVTYLQSVEDIYATASALSTAHNLEIRVEYGNKRGYYLVIPASSLDNNNLPEVFIQVVPVKTTVTCSTVEIASLSQVHLLSTHKNISKGGPYS